MYNKHKNAFLPTPTFAFFILQAAEKGENGRHMHGHAYVTHFHLFKFLPALIPGHLQTEADSSSFG